jgi:DNA topoisomerase-1
MRYLIVVESPAKCKKIRGYLEKMDVERGEFHLYDVVATMGHFMELRGLEDVLSSKGHLRRPFPKFHVTKDKKKMLETLKAKASVPGTRVILAQDGDREGEAIAYHVFIALRLELSTTERMVFHEITLSAIRTAFEHRRPLDLPLIEAQMTRQVLDLLVGFHVSPALWKFIGVGVQEEQGGGIGLSAGRCQSVALRLLVERASSSSSSSSILTGHRVTGYFTQGTLPFQLDSVLKEEEIVPFLEASKEADHRLIIEAPRSLVHPPPTPFTTSSLQQRASSSLGFSPKETMALCQSLYEAGYITYMRTDSTALSAEFVAETKAFVTEQWGASNVSTGPGTGPGTGGSKEAHEAIRPTNPRVQECISDENREKRLYKLIWTVSIQHCMADARGRSIKASVEGAPNGHRYHFTAERIDFLGWMRIGTAEEKATTTTHPFDVLQLQTTPSKPCCYKRISTTLTLEGLTSHYSEANMVRELEHRGIGRPSTYASLIDKLLERRYVIKKDIEGVLVESKEYVLTPDSLEAIPVTKVLGAEKAKLVVQPLGKQVMAFLETYFDDLFRVEYTKHMEAALDEIAAAAGNVVSSTSWAPSMQLAQDTLEHLRTLLSELETKKPSVPLDADHSLVYRRYGPVIHNTKEQTYLPIKPGANLESPGAIEDLVAVSCRSFPEHNIVVKRGKYGLYAVLETGVKVPLKKLGKSLEQLTWEDMAPLVQDTKCVRILSPDLSIRIGPKGSPYVFHKTERMKKPIFYSLQGFRDPLDTCSIETIQQWISSKKRSSHP